MVLVLGFLVPQLSHGQELDQGKKLELLSAGIRGGINFPNGAVLPPGEKHHFSVFEGFAYIGFPGAWEWPTGWEARYRWIFSAGLLRGAGDSGFYSTTGPSVAFTYWPWRISLDFGTGAAYVADQKYGRQDFGGPVQIVGNGGLHYHFPGDRYVFGWRFHHFSDAGIYGNNNRGIDFHILELGYQF